MAKNKIHIGYYAIFFCFTISLHNLEESIWLPQWSQLGLSMQQPVTPNEFHFAIIVVTALAYLTAFLFIVFPNAKLAQWAFSGFLGAMIFNAFFPHLIATIIMRIYAPGLLTGLLLIVPIHSIILYTLHKKKIVFFKEIIVSSIIVGLILLMLITILFKIGSVLINY